MKRKIFSALACMVLSLCLLVSTSFASTDDISFTGVVSSTHTSTIFATIGGTVDEVWLEKGKFAKADTELLSIKTTPVYATESGTVHYFGTVGDTCENVSTKYGAVAYVEPDEKFTISSSTRNAYDSEENKWIVPGEKVYLRSTQDSTRTGEGIVTTVTGTNYTVVATDCGNLIINDSVNIFRMADYTATSRIGRSMLTKVDPAGYTGEGSIMAFSFAEGAHVEKGDVLFETLPGTFDSYICTGNTIYIPEDAVISSVNVKKGDTIAKDQAVAEYWSTHDACIEATVAESDLPYIAEGMDVELEFSTAFLKPVTIPGEIISISMTGTDTAEDESKYVVKISFEMTNEIRYGMHCVVTTSALKDNAGEAVAE